MIANASAGVHLHNPAAQPAADETFAASQLHVSNILLRGLAEMVRSRGVTPELLLGQAAEQIYTEPPEQTRTVKDLGPLLSHAVRLTREPALGLYWGSRASESSFGVLGPLVGTARSLRHAIALIAQFHPLVGEGLELRLTEDREVARLSCHLHAGHGASSIGVLTELLMSGLFRVLKAFGCQDHEIRAVCFEQARPAHANDYAVVFGGKASFGCETTCLELASEALDRPHLHHHAEVYTLLLAQAQRSMRQHSRPTCYAERVRMLLSCSAPAQLPDMAQAARRLGVSVRSLRRRLDAEGTSYRALTQSLLYESACTMLKDPNLTLQEIAHTLGFGDSAAFHRAFRRWSRRTPGAYRASWSTGDRARDDNLRAAASPLPATSRISTG